MVARDPHRFVNELDAAVIERLVARLESRAKDLAFATLFDKYVARMSLPPAARVLEIGCGTGAMTRRLARRNGFGGHVTGVDQCRRFIEAANRLAKEEGAGDRVDFRVGDAHCLEFPAESFDAVIAHTVISHVSDPVAVIREMARVVRGSGTVVIFDGDYASLTFGFPDRSVGRAMDEALASATFNNPWVMRDLPRLLPDLGLRMAAAWGEAIVEIGNGSYFRSFAETYAPSVKEAGLMLPETVDAWLTAQQRSMEDGMFFASCNYYTYLAHRA